MPRVVPRTDPTTRDLIITARNLDLISTAEEEPALIGQLADVEMRTNLGGWAWDTDFGVPYLAMYAREDVSDDAIAADLRARLLRRRGIIQVEDIQITRNRPGKLLSWSAVVIYQTGQRLTLQAGL